jgi:hypothetical protein
VEFPEASTLYYMYAAVEDGDSLQSARAMEHLSAAFFLELRKVSY